MIIYYSMIGWVIMAWFIAQVVPGLVYSATTNKRQVKMKYALFTMAYIVIIIGLRSSVGDTYAYINIYNNLPNTIDGGFLEKYTKDRGFFALSILFRNIVSDNYTVWLLVISCICGIAVARVLYCYSENFFFSMYLFIAMVHFIWMMNGMRQFIAVSILFANIGFIKERKFVKYLMVTLLLSTIHITAIVMIPVYFLAVAKPWRKRFWLSLIAVLICGFSIDRIADKFSYVLEDSAYEGYLISAATSAGSNIIRAAVAIAPPLVAFICKKFTREANDKVVNISINMSCLSAVVYFCSTQSGGILIGRLPIYFDMYNLLLLPWLVEHCFTKQSKMVMYILLGAAYFAFFYSKVKIGMNMGYSSEFLGISL